MPKAVRKEFFHWSAAEIERVLSMMLANMKFEKISTQSGHTTAVAIDRATLGQYQVEVRYEFSANWAAQADGISATIAIEEKENDWTGCLCNRLADSIAGALKTACEMQRAATA